MAISIHFVHVDKSEHLEHFIHREVTEAIAEFEHEAKFRLEIWITKDRPQSDWRGPHFRCEAVLKLGHEIRSIVVKKNNDNFHIAVEEVGHAMKQILRRHSRWKKSHEHRQYEKLQRKEVV